MGWPYQFIDLDAEQKHARRQALDRYAAYAQLSALVPIALVLLFRFVSWLVKRFSPERQRGVYEAVPASPALKQRRRSTTGVWVSTFRRFVWWLGDDVTFLGVSWGQRDQIFVGFAWTVWLVFLSMIGTGNDYLHLTKRFGQVALSQFPLQYLMALKSLNPIAFAFGSSHEQVNRWHRVLGWVIYILLFAHACLYLNFYVQEGILTERLVRLIPALGLASIIGMSFMNATAIKLIRQYSYRVFFITHLIVAMLLPPAIFFHSHHGGRQYVIEALGVFLVDIAKRRFDTVTAPATLELIPGTSLVKIVAGIPSKKIDRFRKYPGMHVYLSIPPASRRSSIFSPSYLLYECVFNPFTIVAVDEESGDLTLVARRHRGPMTRALTQFAEEGLDGTKVSLNIDGPYGCATWFPNLGGPEFQRVLLVAGGVGATFILPLYRLIANENPAAHVQMVWAVHGAGDATWPVTNTTESVLDDENIHLFLTGNILTNTSSVPRSSDESEAVELTNISTNAEQIHKRPDLQRIVDGLFRQGVEERVAILVCGPEEMARELRSYVGPYVKKGRDVWWHNENFAW
ncbi:metalloreductase Fre8 [Annulohypoxylon maeteangense]|uniref:metalloreductase Fre8 n=1 Tax=Annulohypoxylon maeteangense TaxID=1927788 RepID=UPI002007422C|nr:metalloreductase Fre8 [Annulohypoxylon maeteangense]KAI0880500.1 metalloreductase Fre8 [Annulohypoxylon maeteangense]